MRNKFLRVYGIDFSGSESAGDKIWIAEASFADGRLSVKDCYPASDLPGSSPHRDTCLNALRDFIQNQSNSAIGLDFPFGLPKDIAPDVPDWETLVTEFSDHYDDPDDFHESCKTVGRSLPGNGVEYKRQTDLDANSPWCPYNWRLRKQTYFGFSALLAPLVEKGEARVLPMQRSIENLPCLLEVCPSSTLQDQGLPHTAYKGNGLGPAKNRKEILRGIPVEVPEKIQEAAIYDTEGDVIDSIVAAIATSNAITRDEVVESDSVEGYIYI